MSIKVEFLQLDKELDLLEKQLKDLHLRKLDLEIKRNALLGQYLLDEAILSQYPWVIKGDAYLECEERSRKWKTLSDLAETNYHCYTELEKGICLRFDDGIVSISFKDISLLPMFVKKHNLKISYSSIEEKFKKLKKNLADTEELYNLVHGKSINNDI